MEAFLEEAFLGEAFSQEAFFLVGLFGVTPNIQLAIPDKISKIKELHHMQVEIIIHSLKQNNLYLSYPSNMQIITQEQLNVDIFSSQESWSGAALRMRTSSQCLCCKYLQYLHYWQIFGQAM